MLQLRDASNHVYGLIGPYPSAFANNTFASVNGILVPYNPSGLINSGLINPTGNYIGTIYVSSLQLNGQTFSYSSNPPQNGQVEVAGTSTVTTQGVTMVTYIFTTVPTQSVTVQGTLFYNSVPCISALNQENSTVGSVTELLSWQVALGLLIALVIICVVYSKKRK